MTPPIPARMAKLPVDKHGRPVPWFVAWIDGKPDFRIIGAGRIHDAIRFELCWVCGQHRGANAAFVIGPMCAVNRTSAEPPSHRDCAVYSAKACPFLATPTMRRRPTDDVDGTAAPAGHMIPRNPGVTLVWVTRKFDVFRADGGAGVLFNIGDPVSVEWYAEGRTATRDEVVASIDSGLPILRAEAVNEGDQANAALDRQVERAMQLVPA